MNEVNIQKFLQQTEKYLQMNRDDMTKEELDSVIELYNDLNIEFDRQQDLYDPYQQAVPA